jgi:spermidine synthase
MTEAKKTTGPALLLVAIFLINFFSLVYQVVWVRKIMLIFGTTALSVSTVLTVFLAGIALGGYFGGRWIRKTPHKHLFMAKALFALGLYCLFSPYLFGLIRYPFFYMAGVVEDPLAINLLKCFFSSLVLIFPTTVIGAMFPVTTHLYSLEFKRLGRDVASIYFLDTLGAALGALLCGFFLLPTLGLKTTSDVSALSYMVLSLLVYVMSRGRASDLPDEEGAPGAVLDRRRTSLLLVLFLSGFSALVLEVTWARHFHLIFGTSIYAFSLVVAAFLLGLSAGSFFTRPWLDRLKNPLLVFAYIEVFIAGFSLVVLESSGFVEAYYYKLFLSTENFYLFQGVLFLAAFFLMLVPTSLMGANFPLAVRIFGRTGETRGEDAGLIFSFNTAGGIVGAFAAGFIVIPRLGLEHTGFLASALYLGIGLVLIFVSARRPYYHMGFTLPLAALLFVFGLVNEGVSSRGISVYHTGVRFKSFKEFVDYRDERQVLYSKQGYYGNVTVDKAPASDHTILRVNGKVEASTAFPDMELQIMLGHTPLFFHPEPRDVLNIGLGGGFTLGAVTNHTEVESIDCVEIDPLVVEAVALHLSGFNNDALSDGRVRMHVEDGRHYLETTGKKYDVIISEPPNIWVSGVSQLFTKEFYATVDGHLKEGGILAQWVPFYEMRKEDMELIMDTIRDRFRFVSYWFYGSDVVVLASRSNYAVTYERLEGLVAVPSIAKDFKKVLKPNSLMKMLADPSTPEDLKRLIMGSPLTVLLWDIFSNRENRLDPSERYLEQLRSRGRVNSDDLPHLEFTTVRNLFDKNRAIHD